MIKKKHHLTKHRLRFTINHRNIILRKFKNMSDEIKSIITHHNHTPLKILVRVLLIFIIAAVTLFSLNYFHIVSFPVQSPPQAKTDQPVASSKLYTCSLVKQSNPLVEKLTSQLGVLQGSFKGKISYFEKDPVRESYIIKLKSLDDIQEYKFNIRDKQGFIRNLNSTKAASMSALKTEQIIQLSFVCNQQTNLLDFTHLSILPKKL